MADHEQHRETSDIDERGLGRAAAYTIRSGAVQNVLVLEGELDLAAAPELRKHLDEFARDPLVIDFARTTFIDSAVLRELLRARAELAERGVRLVLAAVPPPVRRLMDLTRTSELFEVAPDVEAALKRLSG